MGRSQEVELSEEHDPSQALFPLLTTEDDPHSAQTLPVLLENLGIAPPVDLTHGSSGDVERVGRFVVS